ncbi:hypothetical protein HDU98_008019 [Podochytrium sp. JEL0797]|nr:hypothetical protein HDU98_008019 [Podochytrium sp. JEL0797]
MLTLALLAAAATVSAYTPTPGVPICYTRPHKFEPIEIADSMTILYTADTCNAKCASYPFPGINFSAMVQAGPFVSCYCLIDFTFMNDVSIYDGCKPCETFPNHVGYPRQNFSTCGVADPESGFIRLVSAMPIVAVHKETASVVTTVSDVGEAVTQGAEHVTTVIVAQVPGREGVASPSKEVVKSSGSGMIRKGVLVSVLSVLLF